MKSLNQTDEFIDVQEQIKPFIKHTELDHVILLI